MRNGMRQAHPVSHIEFSAAALAQVLPECGQMHAHGGAGPLRVPVAHPQVPAQAPSASPRLIALKMVSCIWWTRRVISRCSAGAISAMRLVI